MLCIQYRQDTAIFRGKIRCEVSFPDDPACGKISTDSLLSSSQVKKLTLLLREDKTGYFLGCKVSQTRLVCAPWLDEPIVHAYGELAGTG